MLEAARSRQGASSAFPTRLHPIHECSIDIAVSTCITNVPPYTVTACLRIMAPFARRASAEYRRQAVNSTVEQFERERHVGDGTHENARRRAPTPDGLPADVIVSPDTRRANRIPPGQSRTKKWPVLDASGPPPIDLAAWRFRIGGLVGKEVEWNWDDFVKLPRVRVFSDFHCVTRWSRLGNLWEGVSTRELVRLAGGAPEARAS